MSFVVDDSTNLVAFLVNRQNGIVKPISYCHTSNPSISLLDYWLLFSSNLRKTKKRVMGLSCTDTDTDRITAHLKADTHINDKQKAILNKVKEKYNLDAGKVFTPDRNHYLLPAFNISDDQVMENVVIFGLPGVGKSRLVGDILLAEESFFGPISTVLITDDHSDIAYEGLDLQKFKVKSLIYDNYNKKKKERDVSDDEQDDQPQELVLTDYDTCKKAREEAKVVVYDDIENVSSDNSRKSNIEVRNEVSHWIKTARKKGCNLNFIIHHELLGGQSTSYLWSSSTGVIFFNRGQPDLQTVLFRKLSIGAPVARRIIKASKDTWFFISKTRNIVITPDQLFML